MERDRCVGCVLIRLCEFGVKSQILVSDEVRCSGIGDDIQVWGGSTQCFYQLEQRFSGDGGKPKDVGESREEVFEGEGSDRRQFLPIWKSGAEFVRTIGEPPPLFSGVLWSTRDRLRIHTPRGRNLKLEVGTGNPPSTRVYI